MGSQELEWRSSVDSRLGSIESSVAHLDHVNVDARLARMEEAIGVIKQALHGNGQPSRCDREAARIDSLEATANQARGAVQSMKSTTATIAALASFIVGLVWTLVRDFLKK